MIIGYLFINRHSFHYYNALSMYFFILDVADFNIQRKNSIWGLFYKSWQIIITCVASGNLSWSCAEKIYNNHKSWVYCCISLFIASYERLTVLNNKLIAEKWMCEKMCVTCSRNLIWQHWSNHLRLGVWEIPVSCPMKKSGKLVSIGQEKSWKVRILASENCVDTLYNFK